MDVPLDYRAFNDGFDPFADDASRNRIRPFSDRLKARAASYIRDVVAPALGADDAPGFDALIEGIRILEANANRPG